MHILTYLGQDWADDSLRFPTDFIISYTKMFNSFGGVITWDVPIEKSGLIPAPFVRQLKALARQLAE